MDNFFETNQYQWYSKDSKFIRVNIVEYFSYFVLILTSEDENDTTTSSDGDSYTSLCD